MVFFETPTNPFLEIIDIEAIAKIAKQHNILTVVDNTIASPYITTPLDLGADVVMQSCTKAINGHSDNLGGALVTNNEEIYKTL